MRVWGTGVFDNDAAAGWATKFDRANPAARGVVTRAALTTVLDRGGEAAAFAAVAAAATVASAMSDKPLLAAGQGPATLADGSTDLAADLPDLAELALAVMKRLELPSSGWSKAWTRFDRFDDAQAVLDAVTDELQERAVPVIRGRAAS